MPRRSLTVQLALTALLTGVAAVWALDLDVLMRVTSVFLASVTFAGMVAAARLLRPAAVLGRLAVLGTAFGVALLVVSRWFLVGPFLVAAVGLAVLRTRRAPVRVDGDRTEGTVVGEP